MPTAENRVATPETTALRVPPESYAVVFERDPVGKAILEDLVARFHDRALFVKDSARETDFRLGQRDVLQFILRRIGQVHAEPQAD